MFDFDNLDFDLDFDDDFSSKILNRKTNEINNESLNNKVANETPSNCDKQILKEIDNENSDSIVKNENKLKRSFFLDDEPPKKRFSSKSLLPRKFPGPAGLLPDKPTKEICELALSIERGLEKEKKEEENFVYSQDSGSMFQESNYQRLVSDFNLSETGNPLNKYTVEWVKKISLSKGLQGRKIPFLGLVVHSVNQGMPDPVLVLRDPTGEIYGSLHREVWTELGGKIRAGIALALRQVGVLITGVIRRQIYVNITMNNILSLYGSFENPNEVEITTVNKTSQSELLKCFEDWLKPRTPQRGNPLHPPPLFTTVDRVHARGTHEREITGHWENKKNKDERNTDEVLANLGIVLSDTDFREELNLPSENSGRETRSQALSQAETLIFEEVLRGVNLEEFEM